MRIIDYKQLTDEALNVYFNEPDRWKQYIVELGRSGNFKEHRRWYLYIFMPQQWEESEKRSPGSMDQNWRESLFYLNYQILKYEAQGIEPPENLVRVVAKKQREFNESERKHWGGLKWNREHDRRHRE